MGIRLNKVIKEFGVGLNSIVEFLQKKGIEVEKSPSTKIDDETYATLKEEFGKDKHLKNEAEKLIKEHLNREKKATVTIEKPKPQVIKTEVPDDIRPQVHVVDRIDLGKPEPAKEEKPAQPAKPAAAKPEPKPESAAQPAKAAQTSKPAAATQKPAAKAHVEQPQPAPVAQQAEAPQAAKEAAAPQTEDKTAAAPKDEAPKEAPQPAKPAKQPQTQAKPAAPQSPQAKAEPAQPQAEQPATPASTPKPEKTAEQIEKDAKAADLEKRTQKIGEVEGGIFKLHSQVEITAPKVLGTIDLAALSPTTHGKKRGRGGQKNAQGGEGQRKKRNRIGTNERVDVAAVGRQTENNASGNGQNNGQNNRRQQSQNENNRKRQKGRKNSPIKTDVSDEDVAKQVKETLARLTSKGKTQKGAKYRKEKRETARQEHESELKEERAESKVLKLTEFVTANELANMMNVPVTKVIATCMSIGIMVSINQRMDAETINLVAEEFGFKTEYVSAEVSEAVAEEADNEEDLQPRAPIVTVMGHVDHGKTSLLDYIRKSNVIAGEAGGITQHIGAYNVTLENGRHITFLDTPGHEAFTAMRARGAQVTDVAIIIIAADDDIMPQTKEAINHAVAAGVPIVFAINKIDKPGANPDKIKEGLANMNFLVEDWGGKYQSQDISAKKGTGVKELLEKVLLEADMLELKANPNRKATGTVIESALDKGRGYVATVLVSNGTLHVGDIVLAGTNYGRVKALFNERNQRIEEIGPSGAATLLGFNGAPQAGDTFHVMDTEQEVREIAGKREQLAREQGLRTQKMLTLDEVGRRIALGGFKELNVIVKGDVDGSVEALSDSLIKLSTEKIAVRVIHKAVGQISENDVQLAAASQAVIIGFQVRPSAAARKMAEQQGVEIRLYSIIYDAIEEVKDAMEGMLEPVTKEEVTATAEVRQVYHISKVGYVAGAYVIEGKISRTDKARLVRDGIVIYTGAINALKRFKDDVKEVTTNFECGISLSNCNDMKVGDLIETFKEVQVKAKL